MPERAIIPLLPAVTLGFILGVIVAVSQLTSGPQLAIAVVGSVAVLLAGLSSVIKGPGSSASKGIIAVLRAGLAVVLFLFLYFALVVGLGEGRIILFVFLLLCGLVCGLVLAQLRAAPRTEDPDEADRPASA